jgi:5-methylthioadenosine/S-adenosylhomocysteine deaminase
VSAATLGGAKALGLGDHIGSLEQEKQADLAVVSILHIGQQPISDINAALVFSTSARDVAMTMVAGREIYRDRIVGTVDEDRLKSRLFEIGEKLRQASS